MGKDWGGSGQRMGGSGQVWSGRAAGGGTCRSHGNVGIVSEKLQTFRSKERARREFVAKIGGVCAKIGGVWAKIAFCGKKLIFVGKKKCIVRLKALLQRGRRGGGLACGGPGPADRETATPPPPPPCTQSPRPPRFDCRRARRRRPPSAVLSDAAGGDSDRPLGSARGTALVSDGLPPRVSGRRGRQAGERCSRRAGTAAAAGRKRCAGGCEGAGDESARGCGHTRGGHGRVEAGGA